MSVNWNLDALYKSCEDESFLADLKQLPNVIKEFSNTINTLVESSGNDKDKLETYVEKLSALYLAANKIGAFLSLSLSVNSTDELAQKYNVQFSTFVSNMSEPNTKMELYIAKIADLDAVIASSELLTQHKFFFDEIIRHNTHLLSANEESLLSKLQNTGSTAWRQYKDKLISTHKVEINIDGEDKVLPLTEVLNLADSSSAKVRKAAYEAEIKSYEKIEQGVAAALNAIKGEALTISDARSYDSILQMTLEESTMKKETLDAMLGAMVDAMPKFRSYLRRKGEVLGHTNGLPWYDLFAPIIKEEMGFDYEKGKAFVVKNFRTFSDNLADYAQFAMDNEWIDVYPKEGKVGGAFCAGLKCIKQSRILLNYGDTLGDVITMAHELGHGFHNYCLTQETVLNSGYAMPIAETASTICETIVKKAALDTASDNEKIAIIEAELKDCTQVIVDIYSRYLFETAFINARAEGYVSVDQIKEMMLNAQREAYGDGLDNSVLHPYMWTWKSHYYGVSRNFYNFPYAFGQLFAKGLYAKFLEDKTGFPKRYEALLAVTGKNSIEDVTASVGIDVTKKDFWEASVKMIVADIDEFLRLTEK
ncbi:MAG: oligoendopeptidase F [Epulopiscium sp. Nele67-Bin001]|nr:MAG: oligoendopeptidase F [Epulopiscium sp. Nele67-Bin001]